MVKHQYIERQNFFLTKGIKDKRNALRLFILSLKNNELKTIDLAPYYSRTINSVRLVEDMRGGVYLLMGNIIVHYDNEFREELFANDNLARFFFVVRGWDGNIYTAGEPDIVKNWGSDARFDENPEYVFQDVHTALGVKDRSVHYTLIGADVMGRLYFVRYFELYGKTKDEIDIIRFDVQTRTGVVGKIANKKWISSYHDYVSAPNSSLYSLIYDPKDSSVQPKIIKYSFP